METAPKRRQKGEVFLLHMSAKSIPERRCALTGQTAPKAALLRLVHAPDGQLVPDFKQRLPGRGLYVAFDQATLDKAARSSKLKGLAARHYKVDAQSIVLLSDFAQTIAEQLASRCLSMFGLERKAGRVFVGAESVDKAAAGGKVSVLINASDGAGDSGKFLARAKAAQLPVITAFAREDLSLALGRENVVHAALAQRGAWKTLLNLAQAYESYIGSGPVNETAGTPADATRREGSKTK